MKRIRYIYASSATSFFLGYCELNDNEEFGNRDAFDSKKMSEIAKD